MVLKASTIFFCSVLAGSSCWAAAVEEDPYWSFDSGLSLFVFKKNKELVQDPCHFIINCAQKGDLACLVWALSTQRESSAVCDKLSKVGGGVSLLSAAVYGSLWYLGQHAACVRHLVRGGADPNADYSRSVLDNAPLLSLAVEYGVVEVVAALLEGGADITLLDDKELSVFSYLNKIESCLVQRHSLMTVEAAGIVKEKIKKILLRHCADLLFRALDQKNRIEFERLYLFLCECLFVECGADIEAVLALQNDQGMNVVQCGIQQEIYVFVN